MAGSLAGMQLSTVHLGACGMSTRRHWAHEVSGVQGTGHAEWRQTARVQVESLARGLLCVDRDHPHVDRELGQGTPVCGQGTRPGDACMQGAGNLAMQACCSLVPWFWSIGYLSRWPDRPSLELSQVRSSAMLATRLGSGCYRGLGQASCSVMVQSWSDIVSDSDLVIYFWTSLIIGILLSSMTSDWVLGVGDLVIFGCKSVRVLSVGNIPQQFFFSCLISVEAVVLNRMTFLSMILKVCCFYLG